MNYTVNEVAKLSGVSIRTLHYYDEIGLLKPAYVADNGYRYYQEEQLLILQQILFFRELDFELKEIQKILTRPDFDKIEALEAHRLALQEKSKKQRELLETIDKTIKHLKLKEAMNNKELFYGFDSERQKEYERQLIEQGVMTRAEMDEVHKRLNWKKEDWLKFQEEGKQFIYDMVTAIESNRKPNAPEIQQMVKKHYEMMKLFWNANKEQYIQLGKKYCQDPEFRRFYDNFHPKLAEYLAEAMRIFAEHKE